MERACVLFSPWKERRAVMDGAGEGGMHLNLAPESKSQQGGRYGEGGPQEKHLQQACPRVLRLECLFPLGLA